MSDKQLIHAALKGQKVTFRFIAGVLYSVRGYIVGLDDFKVKVAFIDDEDGSVQVTLIHKTANVINFGNTTLADEPEEVRAAVTKIGGPFWAFCRQTTADQTAKEPSQ
jgi:hypothetical protein